MTKFFNFLNLNKFRWFAFGLGVSAVSGAYLVSPKDNFIQSSFVALERNVINPLSEYVSGVFVVGMDSMRDGFINLGFALGDLMGFVSNNVKIEWNETRDIFTVFTEGNKKLFVSAKHILLDFFNFVFVDLVEFMKNNSFSDVFEYVKNYLRPLKVLFARPELDRLQSIKTRFDQFVECLKNPEFWDSLKSMHFFYIKFQDQISKLNDQQLAELVDVFLEDPADMKKKVDLVMENLKEQEVGMKESFDIDLMMDFVRSENVDQIRAKLAATKVSSKLNEIMSMFGGSGYDKNKKLNDSIESIFVSATKWWNSIAG